MSRSTARDVRSEIATVRESWAAWNANDWQSLEALWDPRGEVVAPEGWPEAGSFSGWGAVRRQFERLKGSWERERVDEVSIEPIGEQLLAHGRWVIQGETSGVPFETDFWMLARVREGRFFRAEYFFDEVAARQAAERA